MILKRLLESDQTKPLIEKALSTYPLYKPIHKELYGFIPSREELNQKILNFYKYREIGFETVGRFIDELEISMNEIMPYYNQLYKSVDIMNNIEDIFGNVDVVESYDESRSGTGKDNTSINGSTNASGESSGNSSSNVNDKTTTSESVDNIGKNVKSNTPQSNISIVASDIDTVDYASEVDWNKNGTDSKGSSEGSSESNSETSSKSSSESSSKSSSESTSESFGTTKHTLTRKGNQGVNTYAHDMLEFRELFTNIEQRIINDKRIVELFMLVYHQ